MLVDVLIWAVMRPRCEASSCHSHQQRLRSAAFYLEDRVERCGEPRRRPHGGQKKNNIHFMFWLESRVRRIRDPSFGKTNDDVDLGCEKERISTMGRKSNP